MRRLLCVLLVVLVSAVVEEPAVLKLTTTQGRSARISFDGQKLSVPGFCEESSCASNAAEVRQLRGLLEQLQAQVDTHNETLAAQQRSNAELRQEIQHLMNAGSAGLSNVGPADVFISEYVEGSCNTKAIELHNPTSSDIIMDGAHLQWHEDGKYYGHKSDHSSFPETNALAFDIPLDGKTIPAGGEFVFCREHRITDSPTCTSSANADKFPLGTNSERLKANGGPCDVIIGDSSECENDDACDASASTENAVDHGGNDVIELRLNTRPACYVPTRYQAKYKSIMESVDHYATCGDAIDVVGIPGTDLYAISDAERVALGVMETNSTGDIFSSADHFSNLLFVDHTLRRKASVSNGSPHWVRAEWDATKHPRVGNDAVSGVGSIDDLGSHAVDVTP